ncbi:MAG: ATP-binding protein [Chloroflexota bacterium]
MEESDRKALLARFESLFDFYTRHYKIITFLFTVIVLGSILYVGWTTGSRIREVVVQDFNSQQLVLSRYGASQIENGLISLKREISLLSFSPAIQYLEAVQLRRRIGVTFSSVKEEGTLEIRFVETKHRVTHLVDNEGYVTGEPSPEDMERLEWAAGEQNRGKVHIGDVTPAHRDGGQRLIMSMSTPVWQVSVDDAHPKATNEFAGVITFVVDAAALVEKVTTGIRSGKTGYAWVIDHRGIFLYHPETEFIGKSAFEARKEKKPTISFARINEIQKEMILEGKEGASWYISGWHKGQEGEMKKLIAYAPIFVTRDPGSLHWSLAVVAPMSEVEGSIRGIQTTQFFLEGIGIVVTLAGGLFIVAILLRWSSTIKREVEEKTKELAKSEYQFRSLIEHADDIIYTLDAQGTIISMNSYGHRFFRREAGEVVGHPVSDLFPPESVGSQMGCVRNVLEKNASEQVTCSATIGGSEHWLSINFSGLLDEAGHVYRVLGIGRDITERKKIEHQMAHTEKLASLGTLAAGVAHEINNPLTIVLGFTDLLLEKAPVGSEERELLETIEKQGTNAKRIVDNLLSFARYTEHKDAVVDVNKNIDAVMSVVRNTLSINKICVECCKADSLPAVKGDPGELQQVFFNIISNAVAVMKGGGRLRITTEAVDGGSEVDVRIADSGPGIPKDIRDKIFDPFFTTKKVGEGTGLGLSISYGIISKHGGTITFETRTKDEGDEPGTTFIITLPAVKEERLPDIVPPPAPDKSTLDF